jgi:hypothetical protein
MISMGNQSNTMYGGPGDDTLADTGAIDKIMGGGSGFDDCNSLNPDTFKFSCET